MARELTENDWVYLTHCAAVRDEAAAKKEGPEFHKAYLSLVKEMEEDKKKGLTTTYDVGYEM